MKKNQQTENTSPKKDDDLHEEHYNSLIDEFRRQKIIYRTKKINADSIDIVWDALSKTIARTFKIKRKLKENIEFGMKVKGIFTKYTLDQYDSEKYEITIFWLNANDKYWLHYKIVPTIFKNKFKIRFKEIIFREQTFFGLADTSGFVLLKHSFYKTVKMFSYSVKSVIQERENNSESSKELELKKTLSSENKE